MDKVQDNKLQVLGKLAASLTHEIKNPLSVLKLNLDYLKMTFEKFDDETKECINNSLEAVELINTLIHSTLDFSKKNTDELGNYDINDIIRKSINITKGNSNRKNINFKLNLTDQLPYLEINHTKVLQVIVNLISNAIDANPDNSEISINSYLNNSNVILEVIDEGVGINDEYKDKIFDDFFTNKEGGTGLGLGVCKKLLEEHRANLEFKSNKIKGTCFIIKFPIEISGE